MSQRNVKPASATLGAAFLATALTAGASAGVNPFAAQPSGTGYDTVLFGVKGEGACGEGACGEGACGEGACGGEGGGTESKEGEE
jgi:uncharacterized low-complexity protein